MTDMFIVSLANVSDITFITNCIYNVDGKTTLSNINDMVKKAILYNHPGKTIIFLKCDSQGNIINPDDPYWKDDVTIIEYQHFYEAQDNKCKIIYLIR